MGCFVVGSQVEREYQRAFQSCGGRGDGEVTFQTGTLGFPYFGEIVEIDMALMPKSLLDLEAAHVDSITFCSVCHGMIITIRIH